MTTMGGRKEREQLTPGRPAPLPEFAATGCSGLVSEGVWACFDGACGSSYNFGDREDAGGSPI